MSGGRRRMLIARQKSPGSSLSWRSSCCRRISRGLETGFASPINSSWWSGICADVLSLIMLRLRGICASFMANAWRLGIHLPTAFDYLFGSFLQLGSSLLARLSARFAVVIGKSCEKDLGSLAVLYA